MARNKIKFTSGVFFIALLIGANILLLLPQEHTAKINFFFVKVTSPLLNLIPRSNPSKNDTVKKSEYDELLIKYNNLHADRQEINDRYQKLSGIRQTLPLPGPAIVMASISRITEDGQRNEIIINKGSDDGLKKGQYVLSTEFEPETGKAGSVIGTISELSKDMSRVQLVTDANHHITVDIWRDGIKQNIQGRMRGNNKMKGKIPLIATHHEIRVDDSVFASVKPGFLETSLIIGKVTKVEYDQWKPTLWDITITPIIDIRSLTDVAVVVINMDISSDKGGK